MRGPFYNSVLEQGLFKYIYFKNIHLKKICVFWLQNTCFKGTLMTNHRLTDYIKVAPSEVAWEPEPPGLTFFFACD